MVRIEFPKKGFLIHELDAKGFLDDNSKGYWEPVPQIVDKKIIREDLRKVKKSWVRDGVLGDPCYGWDEAIAQADIAPRSHKTSVKITRFGTRQKHRLTRFQICELIDYDTILHVSNSVLESDVVLKASENMVKERLRHNGDMVLQPVTFYFDEDTVEGMKLWEEQDNLVYSDYGAVGELKPVRLQTPARVHKGSKRRNLYWDVLADYAYFMAPTTKDHTFSASTHDWTAGPDWYPDVPACWMGSGRSA